MKKTIQISRKVKEYFVDEIDSFENMKKMEGQFYDLSHFPLLIKEDADVYRMTKDSQSNKKAKLLFIFRKNILPRNMFKDALIAFKDQTMKTGNSRGKAGGHVQVEQISPNVVALVSPDKFKSRVVYKDGSVSNYYVSNKVKSLIAGYYDRPKLREKSDILKNDKIPCRTTVFTQNFPAKWKMVLPLVETANSLYARFTPEAHAEQFALASKTPQFQIEKTAFSTITVNHNWRTACHVDEGDYRNGYTVVLVAEEGKFDGGFLAYPQFGVAVDVREGDFMLQDPHQYHCNTAITPMTEPYTRLSIILYYRENIQNCV
jgi:hypothetical protein